VWATRVHTLKGSLAARVASDTAGGSGASVRPGWVLVSAPSAGGRVIASVFMRSEAMTVQALSV